MIDEEKLRSLLIGLHNDVEVTSEIIRIIGKSLTEGVALIINNEATMNISEERGTSNRASLNNVGHKC